MASQGAAYARVVMLFRGDGVARNIKTAAGEIVALLEYNDENQDGDDKKIPDEVWWDEIEKLQLTIVQHPDYPYKGMAQSLLAEAKKWKAKVDRDLNSTTGSPLRRRAEGLGRVRAKAVALYTKALDLSSEMSEKSEEMTAFMEKARQENQTVRKEVLRDVAAMHFAAKHLENTDKDLGPAGQKMLKRAQNANRYLIAQGEVLHNKVMKSVLQAGVGAIFGPGLGDTHTILNELSTTQEKSCHLDKATTAYREKKKITFSPAEKKIKDEPEDDKFTGGG